MKNRQPSLKSQSNLFSTDIDNPSISMNSREITIGTRKVANMERDSQNSQSFKEPGRKEKTVISSQQLYNNSQPKFSDSQLKYSNSQQSTANNSNVYFSQPKVTNIGDTVTKTEYPLTNVMKSVGEICHKLVKEEETSREKKKAEKERGRKKERHRRERDASSLGEDEPKIFEDSQMDDDLIASEFNNYLSGWEAAYQSRKTRSGGFCNTWLSILENVNPISTLVGLGRFIDMEFNMPKVKKETKGRKRQQSQGSQEVRNLVYWAVEEKHQMGKRWNVYFAFRECLKIQPTTKQIRKVMEIFNQKKSKELRCSHQTNFKDGFQYVFKTNPKPESYITNDQNFQKEFPSLIVNIPLKQQEKPKKKAETSPSDPRVEYTKTLEKVIKKEACNYVSWDKFQMKVLSDPTLCHLFATLILKDEYFYSVYKGARKAYRKRKTKVNIKDAINLEEDEEDEEKEDEGNEIRKKVKKGRQTEVNIETEIEFSSWRNRATSRADEDSGEETVVVFVDDKKGFSCALERSDSDHI